MDENNLLMTATLVKFKNGEPMSTSDMNRLLGLFENQLPKMDTPDMSVLAGVQARYGSILQGILAKLHGGQKPQ